MKVLVTGGAGFIGSHVVDALVKEGHSVAVVDDLSMGKREQVHPSARFYPADIRNRQTLEEVFRIERPEVVNHHAAQVDLRRSMTEPSFDASVNIVGSLNLLELALAYEARKFINISSGGAVYGEPQRLPVDECHPIRPMSAYGVSKYTVEQYLRLFDGSGLDCSILRYANVYGPRQDPAGEAGVVAIFSRQMLAGERPTIFGDGTKTRDYVYVDDIVAANLLAMAEKQASGRSYNIGLGREVSDRQIFESVRRAVGAALEPILASKRPGEIDRICLDASLAKAELGWEPTIFLEEGIARTVAFYRG
ncbi:UDP-glucose 4-epimerase [Candidatus Methylomirabilis lanthanidiphila]|uniref:UDP-glucose 4-epimerase n=1 Tax=Candidatus Methylomirabilis lanthanidiphila TaxID=2211376 RepID=A0A564ZJ59_9BACT|nr:NAD-dependent epimerase/dehydratase family protein [Candidatus Methylomirabilis lanthanidiphila]VUZ84917.1 UDP-glucose 4-epimerase [Candidatus Methylomirabilis lanthanidiphila]